MIHRHFRLFRPASHWLCRWLSRELGHLWVVKCRPHSLGHWRHWRHWTAKITRAPQIIRQFRDISEPGKCYRFCAVEVRSSCASHQFSPSQASCPDVKWQLANCLWSSQKSPAVAGIFWTSDGPSSMTSAMPRHDYCLPRDLMQLRRNRPSQACKTHPISDSPSSIVY